jgi:hypothetical protein
MNVAAACFLVIRRRATARPGNRTDLAMVEQARIELAQAIIEDTGDSTERLLRLAESLGPGAALRLTSAAAQLQVAHQARLAHNGPQFFAAADNVLKLIDPDPVYATPDFRLDIINRAS